MPLGEMVTISDQPIFALTIVTVQDRTFEQTFFQVAANLALLALARPIPGPCRRLFSLRRAAYRRAEASSSVSGSGRSTYGIP